MMDFEPSALRLAFQLHAVDLVVLADDVTTEAERDYVARMFPEPELRRHGFVDDRGARTPRFQEAAVRALDVLPRTLSSTEKRTLLGSVFDAAIVDDEFRLGEGTVVLMAARLLGLSDEAFDAFLGSRREASGVTVAMLDVPELA